MNACTIVILYTLGIGASLSLAFFAFTIGDALNAAAFGSVAFGLAGLLLIRMTRTVEPESEGFIIVRGGNEPDEYIYN